MNVLIRHSKLWERAAFVIVVLILIQMQRGARIQWEAQVARKDHELSGRISENRSLVEASKHTAKKLADQRKEISGMAKRLAARDEEVQALNQELDNLRQAFAKYQYANAIINVDPVNPTRGTYLGSCSLVAKTETNRSTLQVKSPPMQRKTTNEPWELDRETVGKKFGFSVANWMVEEWMSLKK